MIHYHGADMNPNDVAARFFVGRHTLISFEYPSQLEMLSDIVSTFVLDNGAFTKWTKGGSVDVPKYKEWAESWADHPAFDWCIIPDVIEGSDDENDQLIKDWDLPKHLSVPVWHYHESFERLKWLADTFPRVALGSSGEYKPAVGAWWGRTKEAFTYIKSTTKVHGLRMLNTKILQSVPLSSADSSSVARHMGNDKGAWPSNRFTPTTRLGRAQVLGDRIETFNSPRDFTYEDDRPLNLFDIL